jgi:hypothetical protein
MELGQGGELGGPDPRCAAGPGQAVVQQGHARGGQPLRAGAQVSEAASAAVDPHQGLASDPPACPRATPSASAVRANELAKGLRVRLPTLRTAKLFAKHLKVAEQVEALKKHHALAVGTPARLSKLMEAGALSLSATRVVVLDMAKDSKQFDLLSLPDVAKDTALFLKQAVMPELHKGDRLKVAIF